MSHPKTKWSPALSISGAPTGAMVARFYKLCDPDPESPCVLWVGARDQKGYGLFRCSLLPGGRVKAHRFAWFLHNGDLPAEMQVDHLCHNRACVNANHLQLVDPHSHGRESVNCRRDRQPLAGLPEVDEVL